MTSTDTSPASGGRRRGYANAEGETPAPRPVRLVNPKSVIGTPQSSGPYARLRVNCVTRWVEAERAWFLIHAHGRSVREAAQILGLSMTTTWRRAWWYNDATIGRFYGYPDGPAPHQRGTRAVPRGRPTILPMDADSVLRQLLAAGYSPRDIVASARTVPACVRDLAALLIDETTVDAA